jgi:hypothetical protein
MSASLESDDPCGNYTIRLRTSQLQRDRRITRKTQKFSPPAFARGHRETQRRKINDVPGFRSGPARQGWIPKSASRRKRVCAGTRFWNPRRLFPASVCSVCSVVKNLPASAKHVERRRCALASLREIYLLRVLSGLCGEKSLCPKSAFIFHRSSFILPPLRLGSSTG